jgi:DNA-binding LytR/AlgR family response regulator
MKIILIEDDPLIQIELKLLLIELGHEVIGEFDRYEQVKENLSEFSDVDFLTSKIDERVLAKSNQLKIDDFLAKPFRTEDILICLARLPKREQLQNLNELFLKDGHSFFRITIDDFLWAKAEDNYITINTEKEKRLVLLPLKEFVSKFTNPNILQVHRSYVINVSKIESIQSSELKIGKNAIPIGDSFKAKLFELLNI